MDEERGEVVIQIEVPIGSVSGLFSFEFPTSKTNVSELFSSPVSLMEGSELTVEEEVVVESLIYDRKLIQLDKQWSAPLVRLGNYQIVSSSQGKTFVIGESDYGRINFDQISIRRETRYVVVPNRGDADQVWGISRYNACSFELREVLGGTPNDPSTITRRYVPVKASDIMLGSHSVEMYPLGAGLLRRQIERLDLFYLPGAQPIDILYRMRIGGQVRTARPEYQQAGPCASLERDCPQVFQDYLSVSPGQFATEGEAVAEVLSRGLDTVETSLLLSLIGSLPIEVGADPDGSPCIYDVWGVIQSIG